jgi:hypothetical protein
MLRPKTLDRMRLLNSALRGRKLAAALETWMRCPHGEAPALCPEWTAVVVAHTVFIKEIAETKPSLSEQSEPASEPLVLHLWLLRGTTTERYDMYDSCVVAAYTADEAKAIHPGGADGWALLPKVIGIAADPNIAAGDVICSSFNAG